MAADSGALVWVWPVWLADWQERACTVANRNFTRDEWGEFVAGDRMSRLANESPVAQLLGAVTA